MTALRAIARLFLAACLVWPGLAAAAPVLGGLEGARAPVEVRDAAECWLDVSGAATVEQVADGGAPVRWERAPKKASFILRHGQALWLRLGVEAAGAPNQWFLELPYAPVDRITVYSRGPDGLWHSSSAGDRVPVSQRPLAYRHPLLPLRLSPDVATEHLVRIESPHEFGATLQLVRQDMLLASDDGLLLMLGSYFGLVALGVAVSLVLALGRRDLPLGLFSAKLLVLALSAAALTGVASVYLWPEWPTWNDLAPTLLAYAVFGLTSALVGSAIAGVSGVQRARKLLYGVALLGAVMVPLAGVIDPYLRIRILGSYALLTALLCVLASMDAWRRGDRHAPGLVLALLPLLVATAFPLLRATGVEFPGNLAQYSVLFGTAAEVPVMLLVLLRRSQERLDHTRRIGDMDRVDPATGLPSTRVFMERGTAMLARSQRFHHQAAVLLIDIANAERIERDFSDHRPDELPLRVASRLLSVARDIDVVARLSDLRFGMLVEGPMSPTDEAAIGPRLVASCLMPFEDKPEGWVARVRVAYALVPLDGDDMQVLVDRLGRLLARVPADSPKAVFTLGNTPGRPGAVSAPAALAP